MRPRDLPWPERPPPREISEEAAEALDARRRLREELVQGAEPGDYRWLAGELLEYHRREARLAWWWYFERLGMTTDELLEDAESIGCLEAVENAPPVPLKRSLVHTLKFPPQDHKLGPGAVDDPSTQKSAGEILEIDDAPERSSFCAVPASPARHCQRRSSPAARTTIPTKEWLC
jgi:uncharacterized protein